MKLVTPSSSEFLFLTFRFFYSDKIAKLLNLLAKLNSSMALHTEVRIIRTRRTKSLFRGSHYRKQRLCRDARRHGKGVSEHGKGFAVMTSTANPTDRKSVV